MLNKEDARIVADHINELCRKQVLPFAMKHADLTPEAFGLVATEYLSAVEQRMRARLGTDFDEIDAFMMEGYRRAVWHEYHRLRAAGASAAGTA